MGNLSVWNYHNSEIRVIEKDGEPWWILADVCKILELSNPSRVAERLDDDEKANFELGLSGGATNIINESGLYSVILRSDKPQAKPFKRWVTHEVLPSIRKTGSYTTPQARTSEFESLSRRIERLEQSALLRRVEALENAYDMKECDSVSYKSVEHLPIHIKAAVDCMINKNYCLGAVLDFLDDNNISIPFCTIKNYIRKRKADRSGY